MRLVLDLQKQRCAELTRIGNKLVVNLDLLANFVQIGNALGAQHLLDLKNHGIAILEDNRNLVPDRDPTLFLFFNDIVAKLLTNLLVSRKAEDIIENDLVHSAPKGFIRNAPILPSRKLLRFLLEMTVSKHLRPDRSTT